MITTTLEGKLEHYDCLPNALAAIRRYLGNDGKRRNGIHSPILLVYDGLRMQVSLDASWKGLP